MPLTYCKHFGSIRGNMPKNERTLILVTGTLVILLTILIGALIKRGCSRQETASVPPPAEQALAKAVPEPTGPQRRPIPSSFKRDTHKPAGGEGDTSGSIDLTTFSAGRDLIYLEDSRVWWESENDKDDSECDHSFHKSMKVPFEALVELVVEHGGILKVQDVFRASGVHSATSLHKEGRGLDVTCEELGLEMLARLCWAAGFDWVYYEASSRGGAHVHCSVRR